MMKKISLMVAVSSFAVPAMADMPNAGAISKQTIDSHKPTSVDDIKIQIKQIQIRGATLIPVERLQGLFAGSIGKSLSLDELRSLSRVVSDYYHQSGYPLVSVIIPPQKLDNGVVTLQVIEGKIDDVRLNNQSRLSNSTAQGYLSAIKTGQALDQKASERTLLLLKDLAGTDKVSYRLSNGDTGTVLDVDLGQAAAFDGFVQVDNYGSKATGQIRTRVGANINSPFGRGEKLSVQAMSSFKGVNNARVSADLPIGGQGLSVNANLAHTRYDLGGEFKDLNATGTANSVDVGVRYPLVRDNKDTVSLVAHAEHRQLQDQVKATSTKTDKAINAVRVGISGNHQSDVLAGGFAQWGLDGTAGRLEIKSAETKAIDSQSAKTQGGYAKANANASYTQYLTPSTSLKASLNGQWASKNLDSAEQLSLGGADGISAYHGNDVSADLGVVGQVEARYAVSPNFALSGFYDVGYAKIKHSPYAKGSNIAKLSGVGVGLNAQYNGFFAQTKAAWQLSPLLDNQGNPQKTRGRVWLKVGSVF